MKSGALKFAKFLLGWPLSLVAIYFIWRTIAPQWQNIVENVQHINFILFAYGLASFVLFYFLRSLIWQRLLREKSYHIPLRQTVFYWAISEIKRYLPGKFWFILGRAVSFGELGVNKKDTGILLIFELEIFAIGCVIVSLLALPFLYSDFLPHIVSKQIFYNVCILAVSAIVIFYLYSPVFTKKLPERFKKIAHTFLPDFPAMHILAMLFISAVSLIFFGLGNYLTITSVVNIDPDYLPQLIGFFTLSFFIGFLSFFTPAGLGVREGFMTLGLSKAMSLGEAAFSSIFARIALIIGELIFICIVTVILNIKNHFFVKIEKWISGHPQEMILLGLILLYIIYFTTATFLRYDNFYTGRFDLGNMAQTVWNSSQGRIFLLTDPNGTAEVSRLAYHADFILVLLAPFYYIWANPKMLLFLQTLFTAGGAVFVFLIAKDILKNKNLALLFSFVYLINPSIQRANLFDFHPVTLATFFLFGVFYFCYKKQYVFFSVFALLAALTKEEIWLITALFGLFIFFFQHKRLFGGIVFALSAFMFYFLIWQAIPQAHGAQHFALSYYSDFGGSPGEIVKTTLLNPIKTISTMLENERLHYLNLLFTPVGLLSIFSPFYLIFALPDLVINTLSSNNNLHQIYYQYTAAISPFIFISAIFGLQFLRRRTSLPDIFFIIYLLIFALFTAYYSGPLPGSKNANLDMYTQQLANKEKIESYLMQIPQEAAVSATNNAGSHLSQRKEIFAIPEGMGDADFIVFLLSNSTTPEENDLLKEVRHDTDYYSYIQLDDFIVFKKRVY